jgi:hypothetical protein
MIETKLNTAIPTMLQNNEQVQYFASNTTANAQRMPVKMWTYLDALYLKSKNNASQLNYEQITTTNEFETMLKGTWANSFKGAGKAARTNIQRDYDAALLLSQSDLTVEAPQIPILFRFQLFVYLEPIEVAPAQHRATQERVERSGAMIAQAIAAGTFAAAGTNQELGPGERIYTQQHYARTPMTVPPTRLTNHTARQFSRLDDIRARQGEDYRTLYPNGSWTNIDVLLYGQVLQLPVDVVSLRVALGLPHLDLQHMPEGEAVIDRNAPIPNDIQNMPDTDHQRGVDLAEAAP